MVYNNYYDYRSWGFVMSDILKEGSFTYADYYSWDDGTRWELFEGAAYAMVPAPSIDHQRTLLELSWHIKSFLRDKPCELFIAPFDVRLNAYDEDNTVVQPDLVVICDKTKITKAGCVGAPDFIIEILSPYTARHDRLIKYNLYLKAGVKEYWIVDPDTKTVQVNIMNDGKYYTNEYSDQYRAPVSVLPGLEIILRDIFDEV